MADLTRAARRTRGSYSGHHTYRTQRSISSEHLQAGASIVPPTRLPLLTAQPWQRQVWGYYHTLGTYRFAMDWHSQTMSRVRLTAASVSSGGDEPKPITEGPAADLMRDFFGGTTGQARYMARMDLLLQAAGEGYVVGQDEPDGTKSWRVVSSEQLRVQNDMWQIEVFQGLWSPLPEATSLVIRQWHEDVQHSYLPDAPSRAALRDMATIDLLQKRIVAQAVSRLASNGFLIYPSEITFPAKEQYKDAPDPFTAELFDIATKAIADPGSASAAIPMPFKVPAEYADKVRHLDFANVFDEHMLKYLDFLYDRLATALNMPKEVVTGMGGTSHWNAWTLDEQAVELHIKPPVEEMCAGISSFYLIPALRAMGAPTTTPEGDRIICWYNTSQLDVPPDRSASADAAYDRYAIGPASYRREKGFSEDDAPKDDDLERMLLLRWPAGDPASTPVVVKQLTGAEVESPPAPTPAAGAPPTGPGEEPAPAAGPVPPAQSPTPTPKRPEPPARPTAPTPNR